VLGGYIEVATAQGKNEIARTAEATESQLIASKTSDRRRKQA